MAWDDAHLQAARDYLLERWLPELDAEADLTADIASRNGAYVGDRQLKKYLPYYARTPGFAHPRFTARMRAILKEIGLDVGVFTGGGMPTSRCVLCNYER